MCRAACRFAAVAGQIHREISDGDIFAADKKQRRYIAVNFQSRASAVDRDVFLSRKKHRRADRFAFRFRRFFRFIDKAIVGKEVIFPAVFEHEFAPVLDFRDQIA